MAIITSTITSVVIRKKTTESLEVQKLKKEELKEERSRESNENN